MAKYIIYEFGRRAVTECLAWNFDAAYNYLVNKYQCKANKTSFRKSLQDNNGECALYQDTRIICIEKQSKDFDAKKFMELNPLVKVVFEHTTIN